MDAHRQESLYIAARATSPDTTEGADSFKEKRPPRFPGRVSADLPDGFPPLAEPSFEGPGAEVRR
jgi:hypothetical protein